MLRTAMMMAIATVVTGTASAHPVHEVVQNAYLTLAPGTVRLELELTAGPEVAGRIIRALDSNGDRRISPAEAHRYADRVIALSRLTNDRRPLATRVLAVNVPSYAALLGAHGTIRIEAVAARVDHAGTAVLTYRNGYRPAESRCDANIFLKADVRAGYSIDGQDRSPDGRELTVRYSTRIAPMPAGRR